MDHGLESDTPRGAGGLMSLAASKSSELFCQEESQNFSGRIDSNPFRAGLLPGPGVNRGDEDWPHNGSRRRARRPSSSERQSESI